MDNSNLDVTRAWQRLRRQTLLAPGAASMRRLAMADAGSAGQSSAGDVSGSGAKPAHGDDFRLDRYAVADAPETRPMLYRSEAFAEDLIDSHPQAVG